MIIVRVPLRISFVGGGSDMPDFYRVFSGKVISSTIDKYVYVAVNHTPLLKSITARYSIVESVKHPKYLKNNRVREVMLNLGVKDFMEIGIYSHMPARIGLGGSSAFTVALIKGLSTHMGKRLDKQEIADLACQIEVHVLKEPIGKQDQYAVTYGGINIFQFNPDESVDVKPILLDYKLHLNFENHLMIFFTGLTRDASSVLTKQKENIPQKMETIKSMVKLVDLFEQKLMKGNFKDLGGLLHENWLKKKKLASNVSSQLIDKLYQTGINKGAWGGKILGAGGGGCLLFIVPPDKKEQIRNALLLQTKKFKLRGFQEIPFKFSHSGVEILTNS